MDRPPDKWYSTQHGLKFRWIGINNVLAKAGKSARAEIREPVIPLLDELNAFHATGCASTHWRAMSRSTSISIGDLCRMPHRTSLHLHR